MSLDLFEHYQLGMNNKGRESSRTLQRQEIINRDLEKVLHSEPPRKHVERRSEYLVRPASSGF